MAARSGLVAALALLAGAGCGCGRSLESEPGPSASLAPLAPMAPAAEAVSGQPAAVEPVTRPAGRVAARVDREWLAAAREAMGDPVEADCGPYLLLTDVADRRPLEVCRRIGERLDLVYARRFGLEPLGEPAGAVLLFADRRDFRRYAVDRAGLAAGYAGFSRAARGLVALPAGEPSFTSTLAHELTHLVNRRALGSDLAPWLAEGLSDAIGDAVGEDGLEELTGIRGAEAQARRLRAALASASPPRLARLAALRRGEFDRALPSFDYEHSALAVRMLLLESDLAPGFRRFLSRLAAGETYTPDLLPRAVGVGWTRLDQRLVAWLEAELSPAGGDL